MSRSTVIVLALSAMLGGCASTHTPTPKPSQADLLDRPIDCAEADLDIAALEAAIPGAAERIVSGARLVIPAARIVGRVTGQLDERREIASGRTEADLRARIAAIKATCAIST